MMLNNKIALVTGSTTGIGAATARALAGEGAHAIVAGRNEARGQSVVESIRAEGGTADFIAATLRDESSARALATAALEIAGRVDILVNDAAIGVFGPTASTTEEQFDEMYSVNVKVPFFLVACTSARAGSRRAPECWSGPALRKVSVKRWPASAARSRTPRSRSAAASAWR